MKETLTLLLDADTLIFEASAASEQETEWNEWLWTLHADFELAKQKLIESLEEIREMLQPDRMILALSDTARWRNAVMPDYKNNRKKTRKPLVYGPLREWCHETQEVFQRPGLEGDDVLGILSTHPDLIEGEKIIVAIDKDMQTIPGKLLNYQHARNESNGDTKSWENHIRLVTTAEADRYHLFQTLTGDATDGYSGCPTVGPVKAEKILGDTPSWAAVLEAYKAQGLGSQVALQNARVARICRYTDYDFKKKEVKLWEPLA